MIDTRRLRREMVAGLVGSGDLTPPWREAFDNVGRHRFIPDTVWCQQRGVEGPDLLPRRRADDTQAWLVECYANDAVVTQVDDGNPDEQGRGREVSSSASSPTMVARMLDALRVERGQRVLEIGTGTGWNAALLAYRLGADHVTTIEIDKQVADRARDALHAAGYGRVHVVTGDGTQGFPDRAPYDRVIATVGAVTIPYAWVEQLKPGGRLVAPLNNTYENPGLAVLTRHADGTATGALTGPAWFMDLRSQRTPRCAVAELTDGPGDPSVTDLHPYRWAGGDRGAAVAIGQCMPGVQRVYRADTDATGAVWLYDQQSGSWASVQARLEPPYEVRQAGPRRLFDEVADAYQRWVDMGKPSVGDWLVTVGPDGQRLQVGQP